MTYFKTQGNRFLNALAVSGFWAEVFVLIPISMLGIWWPVWFEWRGYASYLMPAAWFTFGLGSLATIFIQRSFMGEETDSYRKANLIFVTLCCVIGAICYGKALMYELADKPLDNIFLCFNLLHLAIFLNIFVWIWNVTSRSKFDQSGSPLGEDYE